MNKLIITEKPSVGAAYAALLGAKKRMDGYWEGNGYLVSWCLGHLVELAGTESYDERYAKWNRADLPILPDPWQMKVAHAKKKQFETLRTLLHREDVSEVINACDAGREGEAIFRYVYEMAGGRKPVKRLGLSSMEDDAVRDGFQHLRPGTEYDNLYAAALCRAKADWLVGINATRLFSTCYHRMLNVARLLERYPQPQHDPPATETPSLSEEEMLVLEHEGGAALAEMGEFVPDHDDTILQAEIDETPTQGHPVSIPIDGEWTEFPNAAAAEQAAYEEHKRQLKANAGTEVVSDIIFLQKRDRPVEIEPDWVHLGKNDDGFAINQYFIDNPEMVLGRQTSESTQYGRQDFTVEPYEDLDLGVQLKQHRPRKKRSASLSENIQRVIDLETVRARDKGIAYERWATNFNSKAASKSLLYLQTSYGGSYEKLAQAADEMSAHSRALSGQMTAAQKRLEEIDVLRRHILNYAHTREVFQQYKASGYSKKFLEEYRQEIETHRASKRAFNELGLKKLPSKKTLDAEYSQVLAAKKSLYAAYCEEQRKLKELLVHRENLSPYLAPQEPQTQRRKEQDER